MPGGKIHGGGGHGRHSREQRRKYEHELRSKEKLDRAKASRERWLERKITTLNEHGEALAQTAAAASKRILNYALQKQRKQQGIIMLLAVDAWRQEQMLKKAKELKIEHFVNPEDLHYLTRQKREELWTNLVGSKVISGVKIFGRSTADAKEELKKWKNRIPKIAQGQYL